MKGKRKATFCDVDGDEHSYIMTQFGALQGIELAPVVISCVSEPLGQMLNTLGALTPEQKAADDDDDVEQPGLVTSIFNSDFDAEAAGKAVATLAQKVVEAGGPDFVHKLLSKTVRDKKPLSDKLVFDAAYQGNYMELMAVVGWVLTENFSSALGRMSDPFVLGFQALAKSLAGFKPHSSAQH